MSKHGVNCSKKIEKYFDNLVATTNKAYEIAKEARLKNYDPENFVEVQLARNKAERIVGLISIVAPQIIGSGAVERIMELEKQYGSNDWRVACVISLEIAQQKFCKFETDLEAMEVGIRTGFAYNTDGVVSAPIEGFTQLVLKDRKDGGGKYFCLNFSGPIRNAGGTGAATCVIIADYIRTHLKYAEYDPDEKEIARAHTELTDYHERVTNLQYFPSREEVDFLVDALPVEIDGDPTDRIEVSNYKSLDRIGTNFLRGGYCLILSSCVPLKAEKLWKQLAKWGDDLGIGHWKFLEEYISIKKKAKSKGASKKAEGPKPKIVPDYSYVVDLVAGRPVYGYPLQNGGFRIRIGRGRVTGLSAQGISPASMSILNDFIATGTQCKTERPGKACSFCPVDSIEGPTVKLNNGDVVYVKNSKHGYAITKEIKEIIYLGDALCSYGDYLNRAHSLVPFGYCEEWWIQDLKHDIKQKLKLDETAEIDLNQISKETKIEKSLLEKIFSNPLYEFPDFDIAYTLAKTYDSYLHPKHIFHYKTLDFDKTIEFLNYIKQAQIDTDSKIVLPLPNGWTVENNDTEKRYLELIGIPHTVVQNEFIVIQPCESKALLCAFGLLDDFKKIDSVIKTFEQTKEEKPEKSDEYTFSVLNAFNKISNVKLRDKSGVFMGSRMGRPEKAKMRSMKGSPHGLFPVGPEGGRMKTLKSALEAGKVTTHARYYVDPETKKTGIYKKAHDTDNMCEQKQGHKYTGKDIKEQPELLAGKTQEEIEKVTVNYIKQEIPIKDYVNSALKKLNTRQIADLVKGLELMMNKDKTIERLEKTLLRAKYSINVNKDGTVRYDASEVPITHFRPKEIFVPWKRLKELGYETDIYGQELNSDDQVLEILPHDILLPCCPESGFEGADQITFRTSKYIDELLVNLYGMDPFYNAKEPLDIVGHLAIVLAPHVSAGILTRIIGFTRTQGLFAHPYIHCATRRDCVHPTTNVFLQNNFVSQDGSNIYYDSIGDYVEKLIADGAKTKVIDDQGTISVENINSINCLGIDHKSHDLVEKKVKYFIKGPKNKKWIKIITATNREYVMTQTHDFMYVDNHEFKFKKAHEIRVGDKLPVLENFNYENNLSHLNLIDFFQKELSLAEQKNIFIESETGNVLCELNEFNYSPSDSKSQTYFLRHKFSKYKLPVHLKITSNFMKILGFYLSEGYSRMNKSVAQVSFRICDLNLSNILINLIENEFDMFVNLGEDNTKITICSKLHYYLFSKLCGSSAYQKRVPTFALGLNKQLVAPLISSYFDGDGSIVKGKNIVFYSVSRNLLDDIALLLSKFQVLARYQKTKPRLPGKTVLEKYKKLGKDPKTHVLHHLVLGVMDSYKIKSYLQSDHELKSEKLSLLPKSNKRFLQFNGKQEPLMAQSDYVEDIVKSVEIIEDEQHSYCLEVDWKEKEDRNILWGNQIINTRCDGDEAAFILLMDAFLNFSKAFLPTHRGSTMDAPFVLTSVLNPAEVDDMVFDMDIVGEYPRELYLAGLEFKMPWDVKIKTVQDTLGTPDQFENSKFTHDTIDLNDCVNCSAYKTLPSMMDKMDGQMDLAQKIRAVKTSDVAELIIDKHFMKDLKGNLRKFSTQNYRCVRCNHIYRRPPLNGNCHNCDNGKIIFTISEGSVIKYLQPTIDLVEKYECSDYTRECVDLLKRAIDSVFGKEKEIQKGLGGWF